MVHLLGRCKANTVPCRPAVHLALRAAAEPQQFCPEFLYKVQQPRNRGLLLLIGTAKGQAGDVNMKAASSCRMAEIAHALRFTQIPLPTAFRSSGIRASWDA